jgi:hypothetical protein
MAPSVPTGALGSPSTRIGTSKLLGMTPRYWLRAITVLSAIFLAVVLVALAATRSPRHGGAAYAVPRVVYAPTGSFGPASALPPPGPAAPGGASESPAAPPVNSMGTGFPPDSVTSAKSGGEPRPPGEQPVPVRGIVPPGSAAQPQRAEPPPPGVDGFDVVQVQHVFERSEVDIELAPSAGASPSAEQVVRAAYRIARRIFASDTAVTHVVVVVRASAGDSQQALFNGVIDRLVAEQVDPDTDPIGRLESSVRSPDGLASGG